ncbi:MAG: hypothetical protein ACSLFH_01725 [Desulfuromonadales bacterium]
MDAVKHNIAIDIGRDFREWFGFRNDDEVVNPDGTIGSYVDLTGYIFRAQIRESSSADSGLIVDFTIDSTDALTSADIYLVLTDAQTDAITEIAGFYDILATAPDGIDETWVYGDVTFVGRPTKKV